MTFEEFEALPEQPGERELLKGKLVESPPAKLRHHQIAERIYWRLKSLLEEAHMHGRAGGLGAVHHEMGYRVESNAWLQPDVSITHAGQESEDYYLGAPALAVEIVSGSESADEIAAKVEMYLLKGAVEVWVMYPNRP